MLVREIENAVTAMGAELLEVVYDAKHGNHVKEAYGSMNLMYIKWDDAGKAYVYKIEEGVEGCVSEAQIKLLAYERDPSYDLTD